MTLRCANCGIADETVRNRVYPVHPDCLKAALSLLSETRPYVAHAAEFKCRNMDGLKQEYARALLAQFPKEPT